MKSLTVISCLMQILHLFGAYCYVRSDRGKSFLSNKFVCFLHSLHIPTSSTLVYIFNCNNQCEKYNYILWSGVKLALKDRNLPILKWEVVSPQVLHSVRSLLCQLLMNFSNFGDVQFLEYQFLPSLALPKLFMYASTPAKVNMSNRLKKPIKFTQLHNMHAFVL